MPKYELRKMLGNVNSDECIKLMRLIESQSIKTLFSWAIDYVKNNYLGIYENEYPDDLRFRHIISVCYEYLNDSIKLSDVKPLLKEATLIARDARLIENPIAQASARAISTACATIQTPTNALGFIFYGAATYAYCQAGLTGTQPIYDDLATVEFKKVLESLEAIAVSDEPNPVKIKWNC